MKFPAMRSLTFKWIATLLLTSLAGVVLVGLFAYRTTVNEFDRLRVQQAEADFVDNAVAYYEANGSWDGIDGQVQSASAPEKPGEGDHPPMQLCALADASGVVITGSGHFRAGDTVPPDELAQGKAVMVGGERVGTVLLAAPPPGPDPREQEYLDRTQQALLLGGIGAGSVALLMGLLLSQHFLRPLMELRRAIVAMKQGDLDQQVKVRSRDELGELAGAFNQMSAGIYRANQLRRQMTADIAHDLRTPLMVITGYLEALRDGTFEGTPERFEAMHREALLLKRLVDDLRTLSLVDAGELRLVYQSVQPQDLLEQVRQSFEPIADEQQVNLMVQTDAHLPDLKLDRERMVQVLGNLVSNALHYTPGGGSITLSANRTAEGVRLAVSDTGKGIPEDKLPNIFERFYRVEESRTQHHGESGLGLAIAKSIVEAHRGTIAAESQLGSGTSIQITLQPALA